MNKGLGHSSVARWGRWLSALLVLAFNSGALWPEAPNRETSECLSRPGNSLGTSGPAETSSPVEFDPSTGPDPLSSAGDSTALRQHSQPPDAPAPFDDVPEWYATALEEVAAGTRQVIVTDPYATRHQAEVHLRSAIALAAEEHFAETVSESQLARLREVEGFWVREAICSERLAILPYHDPAQAVVAQSLKRPAEPAFRGFAQVEFSDRHLRTLLLQDRLVYTALVCLSVLGGLVILLGFLRLDLATRGVYTGRLQILALVLLAAGMLTIISLARSWL